MFSETAFKSISLIIVLMIFGIAIGIYTTPKFQENSADEYMEGVFWPNPKQIGQFQTIDHQGTSFGVEQLKGKWSILFFGYTYCPDVCPITMSIMSDVQARLEQAGIVDDTQLLFVTVDPLRDTADRLATYINYFDNRILGLGGTKQQVDSLVSQIGVVYLHGIPNKDGYYLVDHTSSLFLIDPDARLVSIFSTPHDAETISTRFFEIKSFLSRLVEY